MLTKRDKILICNVLNGSIKFDANAFIKETIDEYKTRDRVLAGKTNIPDIGGEYEPYSINQQMNLSAFRDYFFETWDDMRHDFKKAWKEIQKKDTLVIPKVVGKSTLQPRQYDHLSFFPENLRAWYTWTRDSIRKPDSKKKDLRLTPEQIEKFTTMPFFVTEKEYLDWVEEWCEENNKQYYYARGTKKLKDDWKIRVQQAQKRYKGTIFETIASAVIDNENFYCGCRLNGIET